MTMKRINSNRWRSDDGEYLFQRMPADSRWAIFEPSSDVFANNDGFGAEPSFPNRFETLGHAIIFAESKQRRRRDEESKNFSVRIDAGAGR